MSSQAREAEHYHVTADVLSVALPSGGPPGQISSFVTYKPSKYSARYSRRSSSRFDAFNSEGLERCVFVPDLFLDRFLFLIPVADRAEAALETNAIAGQWGRRRQPVRLRSFEPELSAH